MRLQLQLRLLLTLALTHSLTLTHGAMSGRVSERVSVAVADNSYGDVSLETSCEAVTQWRLDTALSLLYSFWYSEALVLFDEVLQDDPHCCMVSEGVRE